MISSQKVIGKVGDDVSTDVIYPGRYMATVLPTETPKYAFVDDAEFSARLNGGEVPKGSVVVAGKNFGCGSSREQAASCLKGWELTIVAPSFARIFLQNAINLGLDVVTAPGIEASEGDDLEISFNAKYLIDILSVVDSAQVALETTSAASPGVLRPIGDEDFIHVIMPMHISN